MKRISHIAHLDLIIKFECLSRVVCEWEVAGRKPNRRQVFLTRFHDFTQPLDADVRIQLYVTSIVVCEWEVAGRKPNRRQVFVTRFLDFTQSLDADVWIQLYVTSLWFVNGRSPGENRIGDKFS